MIEFAKPQDESVVWWYEAILERWVDADTAVIVLSKGFNEYRRGARVRLAMINAPERFTDTGKAATEFVNEICPAGSDVLLYSHKDSTGKYGRIEGEICFNGVNINRALLDKGHAVLAG